MSLCCLSEIKVATQIPVGSTENQVATVSGNDMDMYWKYLNYQLLYLLMNVNFFYIKEDTH
jgi:hypothetical protein